MFLQNIDPELVTMNTDSNEDIDDDSGNGDKSSSNADEIEEDDKEDMEVQLLLYIFPPGSVPQYGIG